jgi:hypothetical protein
MSDLGLLRADSTNSQFKEWFECCKDHLEPEHEYYLKQRAYVGRQDVFSYYSDWYDKNGVLRPSPFDQLKCGHFLRSEFSKNGVVTPVYGSAGLLGFNFRNVVKKKIFDFRMDSAIESSEAIVGLCDETIANALQGKTIWLVEGLFDLTALQILTDDPVLSMQTASPSFDTLDLVYKLSRRNINIVFDNDDTGKYGAQKVKRYLEKKGVSTVNVIGYTGKDPGELWLQGGESSLKQQFSKWIL